MTGSKRLINECSSQLKVVIIPRIGNDPDRTGVPLTTFVPANSAQTVRYGNDLNPYMSGINASVRMDDGSYIEADQSVIVRGTAIDDKFNTNDTLRFSIADTNMIILGSNA